MSLIKTIKPTTTITTITNNLATDLYQNQSDVTISSVYILKWSLHNNRIGSSSTRRNNRPSLYLSKQNNNRRFAS